jgi:hypothetical protein
MRAFKTVNDTYIEPISFVVPRRVLFHTFWHVKNY